MVSMAAMEALAELQLDLLIVKLQISTNRGQKTRLMVRVLGKGVRGDGL